MDQRSVFKRHNGAGFDHIILHEAFIPALIKWDENIEQCNNRGGSYLLIETARLRFVDS